MFTNPMIRDVLTIDSGLLLDLVRTPGNDTIFLLGRIVQFHPIILSTRGRSIVIVADEYRGLDGDIWASASQGPDDKAGQNGVDGAAAPTSHFGHRPTGPVGTAPEAPTARMAGPALTSRCWLGARPT